MSTPSQPQKKKPSSAAALSTKYYFAYGSNLHMKQMRGRCSNSRFIGKARLFNYRWQINHRGYANITKAKGYWVDGLVYEIDEIDEAKLDVNEGVSKNAYNKQYMTVLLQRAQSALYRRPISWIVDHGGPAAIFKQAKHLSKQQRVEFPPRWVENILVYINLNYVDDSHPKEEYIKRINLGIEDARAVGLDESYIQTCIRPFIPEPTLEPLTGSDLSVPKGKIPLARGRTPPNSRIDDPTLARKGRTSSRSRGRGPQDDKLAPRSASRISPKNDQRRLSNKDLSKEDGTSSGTRQHVHGIPVIKVEEVSGWNWWPSFS